MSDMTALLLLRAFAVNARIEAMKAENAYRKSSDLPPAYREEAFTPEARELDTLADQIREQTR